MWFCFRPHTDRPGVADEFHADKRYVFDEYCGAPEGMRCGCQLVGHDSGDEHVEGRVVMLTDEHVEAVHRSNARLEHVTTEAPR